MSTDKENIRQLFVEKISGAITSDGERDLEELVSKNIDNQDYYKLLVKQVEESKLSDFVTKIDTEEALFHVKSQIHINKKKQRNLYVWLSAAMFFIVAAFGFWFYNHTDTTTIAKVGAKISKDEVQLITSEGEGINLVLGKDSLIQVGSLTINTQDKTIKSLNSQNEELQTLVIPAKRNYELVLSDGTKVYLNSATVLKFPAVFAGNKREVYLEGEAYFEVTKNKEKPFIVNTKNADIQVLGTSFNVNTYIPKNIKTSLIEGAVRLTDKTKKQTIRLTPGFEAVYKEKSGFEIKSFDTDDILAWRRGVYYFHNVKIEELAPVISRWFDMSLDIVPAEKYNELTVSGLIEKGQLEAFLKDLETSANIDYEVAGKVIKIK